MGRKRKKTEQESPMPPAQAEQPKASRSKSRHSDRRMVAFRDDVYQAVALLAIRGNRPLSRQVRIAMITFLRAEGVWPFTEEHMAELNRRREEADS
jgi:hypothetical protein